MKVDNKIEDLSRDILTAINKFHKKKALTYSEVIESLCLLEKFLMGRAEEETKKMQENN